MHVVIYTSKFAAELCADVSPVLKCISFDSFNKRREINFGQFNIFFQSIYCAEIPGSVCG